MFLNLNIRPTQEGFALHGHGFRNFCTPQSQPAAYQFTVTKRTICILELWNSTQEPAEKFWRETVGIR